MTAAQGPEYRGCDDDGLGDIEDKEEKEVIVGLGSTQGTDTPVGALDWVYRYTMYVGA